VFLTLEDPRARIQGSRDPLGVQPIWSRFGNRVVTNLTTVTTAVRGFTTLLLGRYFGELLVGDSDVPEQEVLSVFLRMEQVAAYARFLGEGEDRSGILGVRRVRRFLDEPGSKTSIATDPSGLILSDQKTYGLWGLYSVSARVSGLIEHGPLGLTSLGRDFVEAEYRPKLRGVERSLRSLLGSGGTLDTRKSGRLFKALLSVYTPRFSDAEVSFFRKVLRDAQYVEGQASTGRQALFARLLGESQMLDAGTGRDELLSVAEAARPLDEELAKRLEAIIRLEALLAPTDAIFGHLQARNGQRPSEISAELADSWGATGLPHLGDTAFDDLLLPEIQGASSVELASLMGRADSALGSGDFKDAIFALLDWNELVMTARTAAPWIRLSNGKLDVRYRGIEDPLPTSDDLPSLWRNSYFIATLKDIARQLEGPVE
jgi:hypothetical protein